MYDAQMMIIVVVVKGDKKNNNNKMRGGGCRKRWGCMKNNLIANSPLSQNIDIIRIQIFMFRNLQQNN